MARKPTRKKTLDDEDLKRILDKPSEDKNAETDKQKLDNIRTELMTSPEWADYPCRSGQCDVADPMECGSICKQWEAWFRLHFRQCVAEGKRIAYIRDERERRRSLEEAHKDMNELFEDRAGVGIFGSDLERPKEESL